MRTMVAVRDDGKVLVDVRCGPGQIEKAFGLAMAEYAEWMPDDTQPKVVIKLDDGKTDCMDCGFVQISEQ